MDLSEVFGVVIIIISIALSWAVFGLNCRMLQTAFYAGFACFSNRCFWRIEVFQDSRILEIVYSVIYVFITLPGALIGLLLGLITFRWKDW